MIAFRIITLIQRAEQAESALAAMTERAERDAARLDIIANTLQESWHSVFGDPLPAGLENYNGTEGSENWPKVWRDLADKAIAGTDNAD